MKPDEPPASPPKGEWTNVTIGASGRAFGPIIQVDSKGLVWIIGGYGNYWINQVWNYDPKTDLYRWVSGISDYQNNYLVKGEVGVQDPNAFIGGVTWAASAIDRNDNIWIYGNDDAPKNLFWLFNTTSLQFTYLTANDSIKEAVSVGKGIPSIENYPGSLSGAAMVVDSKNDLWVLGGFYSITFNSVWHFNTTSMMWTWMWGELNTLKTIDFANNYWNGRWAAGADIDSNDRVWIFGGYGSQPEGFNEQLDWGDLWSFDTKTLEWRVEWGNESSFSTTGSVAVPDEFDVGNYPAARDGTVLIDRKDGTLMIGTGINPKYDKWFTDFWLFNTTSKLWKHVYGDANGGKINNSYTNYRTEGSTFGSRYYPGGSVGINNKGNLLVMGGQSIMNPYLADIWLIPQDPCVTTVQDCDVNAECQAADYFLFTCTCKSGYIGDGKTCSLAPVAVPTAPTSVPVKAQPPSAKTSSAANAIAITAATCLSLLLLVC